MSAQTPLWLKNALVEALQNVGATAPTGALEDEAEDLLSRWDEQGRTIHNGRYLGLFFERLGELEGATSHPALLQLAAAYHGAANDPLTAFLGAKFGRKVEPSLDTQSRLEALGVPTETAARINQLAAALTTSAPPAEDLDAQILWDSNLAVLAVSPQAYAKICRNLRGYSTLDDERFLRARRHHIARILSRRRLFLTPFAARWTDAVRENLDGELSQIDSRLACMAKSDVDDGDSSDAAGERECSHSGPIIIRRTRAERRDLRDRLAAAAKEPAEMSLESAPEAAPADAVAAARDLDETSTLESYDDPFGHRRVRRERPV